ncbi:MAG: NAD(P)-dependent oxidoreductase, partial [Alphaproteobacteria bacterium]|nr:NAD(P)-dependent oxidoreductase [Alphaproteobacteria bacterium]
LSGAQKVLSPGELAALSDVLSIHAPANDETRHLIDGAVLAACRPGAVLINTARGELVDEAALLAALGQGRLAGAALDVLDGEYEPGFRAAGHALVAYAREHRNLLLTPHIGGSTEDAWRETQRHVIERAIAHFGAPG